MNSKKPFISVVIPTYNSQTYVVETLKSVFAQTYDNFEIIVSDDGSTAETLNIVKSICTDSFSKRIRILANPHSGPGATRRRWRSWVGKPGESMN